MFAKNENNLIRYDTTNNKNVSDVLGTAYYIYIYFRLGSFKQIFVCGSYISSNGLKFHYGCELFNKSYFDNGCKSDNGRKKYKGCNSKNECFSNIIHKNHFGTFLPYLK